MKTRLALAVLLVLGLSGCASSGPFYWRESGLNTLAVGITTEEFVAEFPTRSQDGRREVAGPIRRAIQAQRDGSVVEVWTMQMVNRSRPAGERVPEYWFLFVGGRLQQWGLPEDWRGVSAEYNINFNPAVGVRAPREE